MNKMITIRSTFPVLLATALLFACAGTDVDTDPELDEELSLGTAEMALQPRDAEQPWEVRLDCRVSCLEDCWSLGSKNDPAVRACASDCAEECTLASPGYICVQQEAPPFSEQWLNNAAQTAAITAWGAACSAECGLLASVSPLLVPLCGVGCDYVVTQSMAQGNKLISVCHQP